MKQRGFTLLEVMIALTILAVMMAVGWGSFSQIAKAKQHFEAAQDRYREANVAMSRLSHDLSMASVSGSEDRAQLEPREFFVGETSGSIDTLRFTTFSHMTLYADANESDQTAVSYYAGPDRENSSKTSLYRREVRRIGNERQSALPGQTEVLFSDVEKVELSYWNVQNKDWQDTWSTQMVEGTIPHPPDRVKIELTFLDERGKEVSLMTEARVHVQEMLQFYEN